MQKTISPSTAPSLTSENNYDVLIIGCGTAGLSLALKLPENLSICVIAKSSIKESASYYAQGGIASALGQDDSLKSHIQDTLNAGSNLCNEQAVEKIIGGGPSQIEWLQKMGVEFTPDKHNRHLHLTHEGGHSHKRIVHHYDATGKAIQMALYDKALNKKNISITHHLIAIDLIVDKEKNKCLGAYVLNKGVRKIFSLAAKAIVLATGGAGKTYLYTTNPDSSSGDGIAMAWRAGCRVANMHLIQFHPTGLYHPHAKSFLISESLRGEGAKLLLPNGSEFMHKYHPDGELAPRDIVAKAIDSEMKKYGIDCVFLDISHRKKDFIIKSFPRIYKRCLSFGFDLTAAPIPVVPMMHYLCGGIYTSVAGQTDIDDLYAIGENSYTGLHGANRLASNSLLECVVCAQLCADTVIKRIQTAKSEHSVVPAWDESQVTESDQEIIISHGWQDVRQIMSNYVGIVRSYDRLFMAHQRMDLLLKEANAHYTKYKISSDSVEFRNLTLVAFLIIRSALQRKESRGLHYMTDFPQTDKRFDFTDTILDPKHDRF